MRKSSFQYGMKFSIESEIFIPGPYLAAEKQGLGLKFSIENEIFNPRMKNSSENENFVRGGMVFFFAIRARMNFFDPRALWVLLPPPPPCGHGLPRLRVMDQSFFWIRDVCTNDRGTSGPITSSLGCFFVSD